MANDKTKTENLSVESRLRSLYELQTVLSEIDRIKTIRGELPLEVKDLEDNLEGLRTRIANFTAEIEELKVRLSQEKEKISDSQNKIARYKEQLDNVRNNREFDLLTKEVEFQTLEIELAEKHLVDFSRQIKSTEEKISDNEHVLGEKKAELEEIVSETRQDEERLRQQAKDLEPKIDAYTLNAFKRIRKNARNGLGVVYIQRNACGGCFNRIPPQKQLEIKLRKKIIVCEYCGRIIIDPEIAGVAE